MERLNRSTEPVVSEVIDGNCAYSKMTKTPKDPAYLYTYINM